MCIGNYPSSPFKNFWPTQPKSEAGKKLQYQFFKQQTSKAATKLSNFVIIRTKRERKSWVQHSVSSSVETAYLSDHVRLTIKVGISKNKCKANDRNKYLTTTQCHSFNQSMLENMARIVFLTWIEKLENSAQNSVKNDPPLWSQPLFL